MINNQSPSVSVIIPVFNGERYLNQALESVLAQQYPPAEIIVVDDGSTDKTAQIATTWPTVRYVYQPNQGNGAAKNRGLALAAHPLVAFLDVDDRWLPEKLAKQVAYLVEKPGLAYVLCRMRPELEAGAAWPAGLNQAHYASNPPLYAPSALLARRSLFDQIGHFSTAYRHSNDSDWFLRARDAAIPMATVPDVLVLKRIRDDSILASQPAPVMRELMGALRASVNRRRKPTDKA